MKRKIDRNRLLVAVAGIVFTVVGAVLLITYFMAAHNAVKCVAVITEITEFRDLETGDRDHTVYIEYTYNGQKYQSQLGYHSGSLHVGDEVTIEIDPNDPGSHAAYGSNVGGIICLVLGIIVIIIAFMMGRTKAKEEAP